MKHASIATGLFVSTVLAASRTSAPDGCLTVSKSGGDHSTIQAAVNALSTGDSGVQCIFIEPGTYNEQVLVSSRSASQFNIYGSTSDDTSVSGNTVTIVYGLSQADGLNNDETATLRVKASNFRLYNVNVENSYGEGSQAVAVSAQAASGYYGSAFYGFQDTLLANEGHQIYLDSKILGATDFIFGQRAAAWFEGCDIQCVNKSLGYVTAHGRSEDNDSQYVFESCTVRAAEGQSTPAGAYYLGRPWRDLARVIFQNSDLSSVINEAGWRAWNDEQDTSGVFYGEYGNTGAGASGNRVSWATQLSSPVAIGDVLGSYEGAGYFDASYYAGNGADVGSS